MPPKGERADMFAARWGPLERHAVTRTDWKIRFFRLRSSFCPRPYDFDKDAIPAPCAHTNAMSDEVIFYASAEFTSRGRSGRVFFSKRGDTCGRPGV